MPYILNAAALVVAMQLLAPLPAAGQSVRVPAADLFGLAAEAALTGDPATAETVYRALEGDPDIEVRSEARFRHARLAASLGHFADAAVLLRAILDEQPGAQAVRLELARVLAQFGDEPGARRALRQAEAGGLPGDVGRAVEQFSGALRSRAPLGGSLSLALAPDTNINRATSRTVLDTAVAPLQLSRDARATTGLGVKAGGQVFGRRGLTRDVTLQASLSGQALVYGRGQFNDIAGSAQLALDWFGTGDRWRPAIGRTWRWYGGQRYATTDTVSLGWQRNVSPRAQLDAAISGGRADYTQNQLQDGMLYDLSIGYERAVSARAGGRASLAVRRQSARDPGYATASLEVGLLGWREAGAATLFATMILRRLEGDAPLLLFGARRVETFMALGVGASLRRPQWLGFAPVVRFGYERNVSTVAIYDYSRVVVETGLVRAF